MSERMHQTSQRHKPEELLPLHQEVPEDEDDDEQNRSSTAQQSLGVVLLQLRHYGVLFTNVGAWYTTNGMNGIAMQGLAGSVRRDSVMESFLSIVAVTSIVTALQLFFGALLGFSLLYAHARLVPTSQPFHIRNYLTFNKNESTLAVFHGTGSICTNLGFMYGSASLVQIIKLLEPFETLLFTKLLLPDESKFFTLGVTSSMTLTVGAAVSLIKSQKKQPHPHAILFALLSGLTLSTRNVLQRKHHSKKNMEYEVSKLEKSLMQFTQLSWQSGIVMTAFAVVLHLYFVLQSSHHHGETLALALLGLNWRVLTWHPLYNAFSMITLGFCSALTHSLLNAGKRVFAIVMAIVWFREAFSRATAVGLALVFVGGCWYTIESKANSNKAAVASWTSWWKPMMSVLLLQVIYMVHAFDNKNA